MAPKITLACTVCLNRNYQFLSSRWIKKPPLAIKKYCSYCGQHTLHRTTR